MKEEGILDIQQHLAEKRKKAKAGLVSLLDRSNAEQLLGVTLAYTLLMTVEDAIGDKNGHTPAMVEGLASLAIERFDGNPDIDITPWDVSECLSLSEDYFFSMSLLPDLSNAHGSIPDSCYSAQIHSAFVRGNAYPEQTERMIIEIMGPFEEWFSNKCGLGPLRAVSILKAITKHVEVVVNGTFDEVQDCGRLYQDVHLKTGKGKNASLEDKLFIEALPDKETARLFGCSLKFNEVVTKHFPADLCELALEPKPSKQEDDGLKRLLGVSKESISTVSSIKRFPLLVLPSGKVFLTEFSNALDQLWEAFEEVAHSDQSFYDKRFQKRKANWLEERGGEILARLFPKESIYQTLDYPDPDKSGKATAELDLAIKWGPFVVLCESKAKKYSFDHVTGTPSKLRSALKKNAEDSFAQCLRAIRYIESCDKAVFTERGTGRELLIKQDGVQKIYPISLSLHHLGGLATKLSRTGDLNLFQSNRYPFAISVSDLDTILKASITPDIFLHYVEQRINLLEEDRDWDGDEHDLFLAYLDSRLLPRNFEHFGMEGMTGVFFGAYSDRFDRLMMYERGHIDAPPDIRLKIPNTVSDVLDELRSRHTDDARWIAFAILGLDDLCLEEMAKRIDEIRQADIAYGVYRRFGFSQGDCTILLAGCHPAMPPTDFRRWVLMKAGLEKYIRKTRKCIALGVRSKQNDVCECAVYHESEWTQDDQMDTMVAEMPIHAPVKGSKLPGRNEPCVCGSGKKYKKCCRNRIEENRRHMRKYDR